jgi:hypothetical protein
MMILNEALRVFMQGGLLMWPLVLIVLVILGIILRTCWHLWVRGGSDAFAIESCLDGLLFWGGFSVIIGVLGSSVGYHKAMTVLARRGLAKPSALWAGGAEGLVSSIAGLLILAGAGVCWYVFRSLYLRNRV